MSKTLMVSSAKIDVEAFLFQVNISFCQSNPKSIQTTACFYFSFLSYEKVIESGGNTHLDSI